MPAVATVRYYYNLLPYGLLILQNEKINRQEGHKRKMSDIITVFSAKFDRRLLKN
jgi:hypothetical protein